MKKIFWFALLLVFLLGFNFRSSAYGFGLSGSSNKRPSAGKYQKIIEENGGIYIAPDVKEIYLTFDCGYENGHTPKILEALKNTDTKAVFFITGHYLISAPELVQQMIADGHIIGNHTYGHHDFTKASDENILKDINRLEVAYEKKFNQKMSKYVRPPRGEFDERSLKLLNDNGYKSVFWSLAYVDWNKDIYYGNNYSYRQVMKKIHNGAIILMHTVSEDNAVDLKNIIVDLKKDGYIFKTIDNVL